LSILTNKSTKNLTNKSAIYNKHWNESLEFAGKAAESKTTKKVEE